MFGQDTIGGIVRRYLDPRVSVRVEEAEHDGVRYPVIVVPGHGPRPVVAIANGPHDLSGRPVGIRQGVVYIRAAGPESVQISSPDDWNALLDRCLALRADLVAKIVRQTIARPNAPSAEAKARLLEAVTATAADFGSQIEDLVKLVDVADQPRVTEAGRAFSVLAYGFVGEDGELIELDSLRALNDRVSVAMHDYAYCGWTSFLPLTLPERAPQMRTGRLEQEDRSYLEGMRLPSLGVLHNALDYWHLRGGDRRHRRKLY